MSLVLLIVFIATLGPLLAVFIRSFQVRLPESDTLVYGISNWARVFSEPNLLLALGNSALIASSIALLSTVLAIFFSWVVTRTDTPFTGFLEFVLWMGFFFPLVSQALGWMLLLDPSYGLINQLLTQLPFIKGEPLSIYSYGGIIWAQLAFSTSARFILISPAFRRMDPSLEDAARMSGSSNLKTLLTVTIPVLAPSILAAAFLGFIKSLEGFEIELLLGVPAGIFVYSTKIFQLIVQDRTNIDFEGAAALSSVFLLLVFLLILLYGRLLGNREYATVTGRGFVPRITRLGRWRWATAAFSFLFLTVNMIAPTVIIMLGTFMKLFGFFNLPEPYTLNHWVTAVQDNLFLLSLRNSALLGLGAGLIGVFAYVLISYIIVKTEFKGRRALDFVSWMPWTLPGILLGLGLLWLFLGNPVLRVLHGTLFGLIIAMIIKDMPVGTQMTKGALMQISRELEEASAMSGASWRSTFQRILVPIMLPSMLSVALIVFISSVRDVSLVVLLASHGSRTLSLLMIDYVWAADLGKASVIGALLVLMIVALASIAKLMQRRFEL